MPLTERNSNISRTGERARTTVADGKENSNTPKPKQKTPVKTKPAVTASITKKWPRRSRTQRRGRSQRRGRGRGRN